MISFSLKAEMISPLVIYSDTTDERSLTKDSQKSFKIDRKELNQTQNDTIGSFLSEKAGLDYRVNASGLSGFSIRGSRSEHILVIVDGVRMNDPSDPSRNFDFSKLDRNRIESIEIIKGAGSVAYGGDALGGVVLIATHKKPENSLFIEGGSYSTAKTQIILNQKINTQLNSYFNVEADTSKGPSSAKALKGDLDRKKNVIGKAGLLWSNEERTFFSDFAFSFQKKREELDSGNYSDNNAYVSQSTQKTIESKFKKNWNDLNTTHLQASYLQNIRVYEDENGDDTSYSPTRETYKGNNLQTLMSHQSLFNFRDRSIEMLFGIENNSENLSVHSSLSGSTIEQKSSNFIAAFIQSKIALHQNHDLLLGVRETSYKNNHFKPVYRGSYTIQLGSDLTLDTTLATGYKPPTLFQLYSPTYGNQNLKNESSFTKSLSLKSNVFELSFFQNDFKNLISLEPYPSLRSKNISRGKVRGIEGSLNFKIISAITFTPHYTYLNTINPDSHSKLPGRPTHKGGLNLEFSPSELYSLGSEWILKSNRYEGYGPDSAGYGLLHFSGKYNISDQNFIFFRLENALNKDYMEINGYSSPERSYYIGFQSKI